MSPPGTLSNGGIVVLGQEHQTPFQQLQSPTGLGRIMISRSEDQVHPGAGKDDLKGLGILFQGFFRFLQGRRVQAAAIGVQTLRNGFLAVVLHPAAQQGVYGGVEKVRQLHDQVQLRHAHAGLPFVHGSRRDPQHFRQLLLGQPTLFPQGADIAAKVEFHARTSFSVINGAIVADGPGKGKRLIILTR